MKKTLKTIILPILTLVFVLSSCLGNSSGKSSGAEYVYITEVYPETGMTLKYGQTYGGRLISSAAIRELETGQLYYIEYEIDYDKLYAGNIYAATHTLIQAGPFNNYLKFDIPTPLGNTINPTGVRVYAADPYSIVGDNWIIDYQYSLKIPSGRTEEEIEEIKQKIEPAFYFDGSKQQDKWEPNAGVGATIDQYRGMVDFFLLDKRDAEDIDETIPDSEAKKITIRIPISFSMMREYLISGIDYSGNITKPVEDAYGNKTLPFKIRYDVPKNELTNPEGKEYIGNWANPSTADGALYFVHMKPKEDN